MKCPHCGSQRVEDIHPHVTNGYFCMHCCSLIIMKIYSNLDFAIQIALKDAVKRYKKKKEIK